MKFLKEINNLKKEKRIELNQKLKQKPDLLKNKFHL